MSVSNEVFIVFSFIGFLMCCIPLPWHLEAWNVGTCLYMAWTGLACLNQFVNAIVWNHNAINWAPVWCDISTRIIIGSSVAIPAASLCINRRLYHISARSVGDTRTEKYRSMTVDLAICLVIPIIVMILQYIPQGHRFDIFEDVGCYPAVYNTPIAIVLVWSPPIVVGCISAVYSILSIRAFSKSRVQFKQFLSTNRGLSRNRYIRLMLLAGIETVLTIPLAVWTLCSNSSTGRVSPWNGWKDTHLGFSRVDQVPAIIWRSNPHLERALELTRFFAILCAFTFFAFFGFAEEARKNYCRFIQIVAGWLGLPIPFANSALLNSTGGSHTRDTDTSFPSRNTNLPLFNQRRHKARKHSSMDSFCTSTPLDGAFDLPNEKRDFGVLVSDTGTTNEPRPFSPTLSSHNSRFSDFSSTSIEAAVVRPQASWTEICPARHSPIVESPGAPTTPPLVFDGFSTRHTPNSSF